MSQHIHGDIRQNVGHDYGEFVQIGPLRVRKDLVAAYCLSMIPPNAPDHPLVKPFGINVLVSGHMLTANIGTQDEAIAAVEKLDWQYKKDLKNG